MNLKAFKSRVLPTKDKLFRFALSITHDRAEAEDVVQEVFIKLWDQRLDLEVIQNMEAWCMRLTRNLSIDKLRSKHRRTNPIEAGFDLETSEASPLERTEQQDTVALVRAFIRRLPDKQQQVMQLRDIEGFTYQEISDTLGIPLNQVKVNLHRARQAVRTQLLKMEKHEYPKHQ